MRVVAGEARGRRLQAPPGRSTRPTSDRVREAVFGSLGSLGAVAGARVVDLFAGSGAMGIEALSRGAASATFVERDAAAVRTVEANLAATGLAGGRVVRAEVLRWLGTRPGRFDLALADPPYGFEAWPELLGLLEAGVAVLESDAAVAPGPDWRVLRERRYGTTVVTIVASRSPDGPATEEGAS